MSRLEKWQIGKLLIELDQVTFLKKDYPSYGNLFDLKKEVSRAAELAKDSRKGQMLERLVITIDQVTTSLLVTDTVLAVLSTGREL